LRRIAKLVPLQKPSFDPGLTQTYDGPLRRIINSDGSFNILRRGTDWRDIHPYLHLVSIPWTQFFCWILLAYVVVNSLFATVYFLLGSGALAGRVDPSEASSRFLQCFFFSSQTLTTVGFGAISPASAAANVIAALEALTGLLSFAVATGLLFGRVSRPSARIGFSEVALIAPYQDGTSFQFRIVNRRTNTLLEPSVTVLLMTVDRSNGAARREIQAPQTGTRHDHALPAHVDGCSSDRFPRAHCSARPRRIWKPCKPSLCVRQSLG